MGNGESKNFNRQQLRMMSRELRGFRLHEISLGNLIMRLKGLYWALESPGEIWGEQFLSAWGALESANAMTLYRRERGLAPVNDGDEDGDYVSSSAIDAVERIDHLIQAELAR